MALSHHPRVFGWLSPQAVRCFSRQAEYNAAAKEFHRCKIVWIFIPHDVCGLNDPAPQALEDHRVDFAHADFSPHGLEEVLSVLGLEALAFRHVDGG